MIRDPFITALRGLAWLWITVYVAAALLATLSTIGRGDFTVATVVVGLPLLGVICAPAVLVLRHLDPVIVAPARLDDLGL